jgi:hypothetical protein
MTSSTWAMYDIAREWLANGTLNMAASSPGFQLALFTNGSNVNSDSAFDSSSAIYANVTYELANGDGYTTGGAAVSGMTVTYSGATATIWPAATLPTWTASGGSLTFRYGVIYVNGTVNSIVKPLICWTTWDNTPADIVVNNGITFTPLLNASGLFTITGM